MTDNYDHDHYPKILAIEGNIGTGKTTLIDALERVYATEVRSGEIVILREPVDQWMQMTDDVGTSILELFYQDPATYAFPFQVAVLQTVRDALEQALLTPGCKLVVCERSVMSGWEVFAKMLRDEGRMTRLEYQIYEALAQSLTMASFVPLVPFATVYLEATTETCLRRIETRNRSGEGGITRAYLDRCAQYHEAWLSKNEDLMFRVDVNDYEKTNVKDEVVGTVQTIVEYVKSI